MIRPIHPIARYFLVCAALFLFAELSPFDIGDRFYRFDRSHYFLKFYYPLLFLIGVIARVYEARTWLRCALWGAFSGLLSGLVAQVAVVMVTETSLELFTSESLLDLAVSFAMGSLIFATPFWGVVATSLSRALVRRPAAT